MKAGLRLRLALLSVCSLVACGSTSVRSARPAAYVSPELQTLRLRRIVLAPPSGPGADAETREAVLLSISAVLSRRLGVDVLTADEVGEDVARDAEQVTRGVVPSAALIALERRTRADAVLFVRVQAADPYPPQRLVMRVDLISARTGSLLLRNTVSFDAAEEADRDRLRALAEERGLGAGRPLGSDVAFLSRRRFTDLASAVLLEPLGVGR